MRALILDFDQTIADTSMLDHLRRERNWQAVYRGLTQINLYTGIIELIAHARAKCYSIGVVTSSPKKYCELALAYTNIEVDTLIGYHCTPRKKPFPDPILAAVKNLNATAELSFGLGDNLNDIKAYNSAGLKSVSCLWGAADTALMMKCEASLTIRQPKELYSHL